MIRKDESDRTPLVSVILPTYEDAEYIDGALDSIRKQTYENVEIVIIDSTGVPRLEQLDESRDDVVYEFQPPEGPAAARNRGIELASGDLIAFLDADDRWHPDKLQRQVAAIADGADVVYSDQQVTNA